MGRHAVMNGRVRPGSSRPKLVMETSARNFGAGGDYRDRVVKRLKNRLTIEARRSGSSYGMA